MTPANLIEKHCRWVDDLSYTSDAIESISNAISEAIGDAWCRGHNSAVIAMQEQLDDAVAEEREAIVRYIRHPCSPLHPEDLSKAIEEGKHHAATG